KATGKEQSIKIEASSGLSESEIDKMVQDAETHASEDSETREKVDVRNAADQAVYQTEKQMAELADKMDDAAKKRITDAAEAVKQALTTEDTTAMKDATETLQKAWHEEAGKLYAQASDAAGAEQAEGGPQAEEPASADGEPIDADYEVVDEEKK
ncbi:MAG: Hsp70 family protein, partial [Gemmatimonadota bacterium]|nr:Hsp70 family protein [Gemmatimonadota bacterium]